MNTFRLEVIFTIIDPHTITSLKLAISFLKITMYASQEERNIYFINTCR